MFKENFLFITVTILLLSTVLLAACNHCQPGKTQNKSASEVYLIVNTDRTQLPICSLCSEQF